MALTLQALTTANTARQKEWLAGRAPLSLEFSAVELAGETGEACNEVKKIIRHRNGLAGGKDHTDDLARELADVVICANLVAIAANINLAHWVPKKFNETSDKHGFTTRLPE